MTYSIQRNGQLIAFTDSEGLHKIRNMASQYGYKIVKIEEPEGRPGYVVTMEKVKKLAHYKQNEPMKESA